MNNVVKPPCGKVCSERQLGCHSKCEKYIEYEKQKAEYYATLAKDRAFHYDAVDFKMKNIQKTMKRR